MPEKPLIWLLDDSETNWKTLVERHGEEYRLRWFPAVEELFSALEAGERPELLLCDVFFPEADEETISRLREEAAGVEARQEDFAHGYRAAFVPRGLEVVSRIRRENHVFPCVFYSRRAHMLLDEGEFSELNTGGGPVWIMKGRENAAAERSKIEAVLDGARLRRRYLRLRSLALVFVLAGILLGWALGVLLAPLL